MTESKTIYYKYTEPTSPVRPAGSQLHGYTYRSFLISRSHTDYLFWKISMPDGTPVPEILSTNYTQRHYAEKAIDGFISNEAIKQERAEKGLPN
jgi:hypothetical protein